MAFVTRRPARAARPAADFPGPKRRQRHLGVGVIAGRYCALAASRRDF
jgi:hypothetical protein